VFHVSFFGVGGGGGAGAVCVVRSSALVQGPSAGCGSKLFCIRLVTRKVYILLETVM